VAAVRSLLTRVAKLEQAREPVVSPFELAYGSVDSFEAVARAAIDLGTLDQRDGASVIEAVRSWHEDRLWDVCR